MVQVKNETIQETRIDLIERGLLINPYKYEKEPTRISASKFPNYISYKRPKPNQRKLNIILWEK